MNVNKGALQMLKRFTFIAFPVCCNAGTKSVYFTLQIIHLLADGYKHLNNGSQGLHDILYFILLSLF